LLHETLLNDTRAVDGPRSPRARVVAAAIACQVAERRTRPIHTLAMKLRSFTKRSLR